MVDYCAYFDNKSRLFEEDSEYNRCVLLSNCKWALKRINYAWVRPTFLFEILDQLDIPYKYDDVKNLGWKDYCHDELMGIAPIENSNAFLVTFHCQEL